MKNRHQYFAQRKKISLFKITLFFLFTLAIISLISLAAVNKVVPPIQKSTPSQKIQEKNEVLGYSGRQKPQIFLSGGKDSFGGGGMISLASTDEPTVEIGGYNISGEAEVTIYEANEEALLAYLTHDKDSKQTKKLSEEKFKLIATTHHKINSDNKSSSLILPLNESGIWFLRIKLGSNVENGFVIRSNFGIILKEGDNQYIFWGQNFKTRRSITEGTLTTYNLLDRPTKLAVTAFDSEGIAKMPLSPEADIALIKQGEEVAIVPVNLRYLNTNYTYHPFQPKSKITKYFIFTDRPLYKPGDTIYFKAILRNDDDARYTIPQGFANVKIYKDWDEKNTIFERNIDISSDGSINGEYKLSADGSTGFYQLKVAIPSPKPKDSRSFYNWEDNSISFQVDFFRKPEYFIDITIPKNESISGDKTSFKISGNYFSGQPLAGEKIKYTVYSANYYQYEYYTDTQYALNDNYYGYWGDRKIVTTDTATLNLQGEAEVNLETKLPLGRTSNQIFSIEAEINDGSGNPSFARKNMLVFAGEYEIFRKDTNYGSKLNTPLSLTAILVPRRNANVSGISLSAKIRRENWIQYQEPDKKYPSYKKEEESISEITSITDTNGLANFTFTPTKPGSYYFTIEGEDNRKNLISKVFHVWVSSEDQPYYSGEQDNEMTIKPDKAKYQTTEVVKLTISSNIPDRDIFLSFERARVNRFQIVHLKGKIGTFEIPLVETDMPNIWANISSFSNDSLDTNTTNVIVSTDKKKLVINVTPNQKTYGPGETVTLNIQTTDIAGNPLSAQMAVWAVDKALFELVDSRPETIFETFWRERSNNTNMAHSLEGITVLRAEGGGCFAAGTSILTSDKKTRNIENIKIGDTILTRTSETDSRLIKAKVKNIHQADVSGYLLINGHLKVTANHRLRVNNSWIEAGNIQPKDVLIDYQGNTISVTSIVWQPGKYTVYNLEIEKYHTFFAGGYWVHNQKGDGGRTIFKDTAYWNPAVSTDISGRAKVSFKLPDNLTTWAIAAIGSTPDTKVGQTTNEIVVTKNVIVRPILPNILRVDDRIVLSALIQNFTPNDHAFDVDLTFDAGKTYIQQNAPNQEIKTATYSSLLIKTKETKQLYWDVIPLAEKTKAKITFSARATDDKKISDVITQEIPVWVFGFFEKKAETGDGPKTFTVKLFPDSHRQKSEITLSLASTIIKTLPSAMQYLIDYPYGCVEQTTSRFIPAVIAKTNPDLFASFTTGKNLDEIIKKSIQRLAKLQHSDGGWSWWQSGDSDPFVSAYVVEYLLLAKKAGIAVDNYVLDRATSFLQQENFYDYKTNQSNQKYGQEDIIVKTYALSLLGSEKGKIPLRNLTNLSPDILSLALITNIRNGDNNPQTNGLTLLISMAKIQGEGVFWEAGKKERFGSVDASTALAIQALTLSGSNRESAVKAVRFLTKNRKANYWSNTFATAQIIRAVTDFANTGNEFLPNYSYIVTLDGQEINRGTVSSPKQTIPDITIPITKIKPEGSILSLTKSGEGQIYSTLVINELRTDRKATALNHGLKVKREYVNDKGKEYPIAVGDTVKVEITLEGLETDDQYGIITDELPSGLIPINLSFKNEQYGQDRSFYYRSYDITDQEITENGTILSLYQIAKGPRTYLYKARAVVEGEFIAPPAFATLMYSPEIYGQSEVQTLKISKASQIAVEKPAIQKNVEAKNANQTSTKYIILISVFSILILISVLTAIVIIVVKKRINHQR